MKHKRTEDLLIEYRATVLLHGQATDAGDSRGCNRAHDKLMRLQRVLRDRGDEYQRGILALLDDEDPHVRVWAASDALAFAPDEAVRVLREVASSRGLASLNARMTLQLWDAGEWQFY